MLLNVWRFAENLAAGTGSSYDIAAAVKSWTDEVCECFSGTYQRDDDTHIELQTNTTPSSHTPDNHQFIPSVSMVLMT